MLFEVNQPPGGIFRNRRQASGTSSFRVVARHEKGKPVKIVFIVPERLPIRETLITNDTCAWATNNASL